MSTPTQPPTTPRTRPTRLDLEQLRKDAIACLGRTYPIYVWELTTIIDRLKTAEQTIAAVRALTEDDPSDYGWDNAMLKVLNTLNTLNTPKETP